MHYSVVTRLSMLRAGAKRDWYVPIVADAEAGFGGPLNCFELMKGMIEAGAAGVHFEDQLASEKKCGHLGGKVRSLLCCLLPCLDDRAKKVPTIPLLDSM